MLLSLLVVQQTISASLQVPNAYTQQDLQGNDFWTWLGPQYNTSKAEAPLVYDVLFDPANPDIVYVASNQGVYRSANTGDTWSPRNSGLGGYGDLVVMSIIKDLNQANTLLIGTWGYGLFRSTNNGGSWVHLADPLGGSLDPTHLETENGNRIDEISDKDPPLVMAGGSSPQQRYPGRPVDAGRPVLEPYPGYLASEISATPLDIQGLPQRLAWTPINQVGIHPANSTEIYACVSFVGGNQEGLYRSQDTGATWAKLVISDPVAGTTASGSAYNYTFSPSNSQVRYASFENSLYKTTNGGGSWMDVGKGYINKPVAAVAIHPSNPNIVLAGTRGGGLYRTTNGGSTWSKVVGNVAGEDLDFHSIVFSPSNPAIVYAGGHTWIYRSTTTGQSWGNADSSLVYPWGFALAIHPTQPETVLAGSNAKFPYGGVYKRTQPSDPFLLKPTGMEDTFVMDIELDPINPSILYAATWGAGIFRSNDGGLTWSAKYGYPYTISLETVPQGSLTILYAGTFFSDSGVLKSIDQGDQWSQTSHGYKSDISFDIEAMGTNPNQLVAATYLGMQYSTDGGMTWNDGRGLTDGVTLAVCEFGVSKNFLAGTYGGGIFWSPNGIDWYEANQGLSNNYVYDIACDAQSPGLAYAGTLGVYRTRDAGQHWESYKLGLPNDWVRALDVLPTEGDVFAGTHQSGVYVLPKAIGPWTGTNASLLDQRIRSIRILGSQPTPRVFAGTNGTGAWEYTMVNRPPGWVNYFPLLYNTLNTFSSQNDTYEPNNSRPNAYPLASPGTYYSYIWNNADVDWYRINVTSLGTISVTLANMPIGMDYDLGLYTGSGLLLTQSNWGGDHDEKVIFMPSQTGYYYVKVTPYQNAFSPTQAYRLELTYNGAAPGGNGIYGRVTESGVPVSNIPILLKYHNGYVSQSYSTVTDGSGYYHFRGIPALLVGHTYQVVYPNYEANSSRVSSLACAVFLNYPLSGADHAACSFDIAKTSHRQETSMEEPVKQISLIP